MKTPKLLAAFADLPSTIEPPKMNSIKDRRLGKKLYITVAVIVALVTLAVALLVTQGTAPNTNAQTEWSKTYYGDTGHAVQTSDGGYAIAGSNASIMYPAWERAPILIKTDASGELLWNKTFDATGHVATSSIVQTKDGGYALSGTNIAPPIMNPVWSGWLIKTDDRGTIQWNKTFGLPLQTCFVIQGNDGNYVLTGYATNNANGADTVLMKVNANGNLLWTKTFGGNSSKLLALSLVEANDGGYVIEGALDRDGWLAKTDANGNLQWSQTYHPRGYTTFPFNSIAKTKDSGYILAGGNLNSGWIVKTDSSGNTEWIKALSVNALMSSVTQTADGGYVAVGGYDRQAYLVRTDASGTLMYNASYGEVNANVSSSANSVVLTSDGGFVVAGTLNHYSPTNIEGFSVTPTVGNNVWLAKFPLETSPTSTGSP
jgi:hypothetical protein